MRFSDRIIALQLLKYAYDFIIMVFVKLSVERDIFTRRRRKGIRADGARREALCSKGSVGYQDI
jgi:hypothetical protein